MAVFRKMSQHRPWLIHLFCQYLYRASKKCVNRRNIAFRWGEKLSTKINEQSQIGSRIRDRRQAIEVRQADLARQIGISASYLNLIEHNRRAIGGKLLRQISQALCIDTSALTQGPHPQIAAALARAHAADPKLEAETAKLDEFVARFPGWANLLAATQERVEDLEVSVTRLKHRLKHDGDLADAVHEVLSTAASIRSTAAILAETKELDENWRQRFHANIDQDSSRLAESSRALADYLEAGQSVDATPALPTEEVEKFIARHGYHFAELEHDPHADVSTIVERCGLSLVAQGLLSPILKNYANDARLFPLPALEGWVAKDQLPDPVEISKHVGLSIGLVLRRLASAKDSKCGLLQCDRSGTLTLFKPVVGFTLPRFGMSGSDWPLYKALSNPGFVIREPLSQKDLVETQFDCIAIAEPQPGLDYNSAPMHVATMILFPLNDR